MDVTTEFERFGPDERADLFFPVHRHLTERGKIVAAMICTAIARLSPLSERPHVAACGRDGPRSFATGR